MNDINEDTWKYFLREIINPDQAITSFFIAIRHEPFFVSTIVDEGICKKDVMLRITDGTNLSIKRNNEVLHEGTRFNVPDNVTQYVSDILEMKNTDKDILSY